MTTYNTFLILMIAVVFSSNTNLFAQENNRYRLLFQEEVFFSPAKASLKEQYKQSLSAVKTIVKEEAIQKVIVHAHTDSIGSAKSNEKLSYQRAETIVQFLDKEGIDPNLIEIRTYGEYNPIAANNTAAGRAKNRRVSVKILGSLDTNRYNQRLQIRGKILNTNNNKPLDNARILMIYLGGMDTLYTDEHGQFEKEFKKRVNVEVRVYAKNFFFASKLVKLGYEESENLNFSLEPAIIGGRMFLSDLYFKPGTALLLPSSAKSLEGINSFMDYNDQLKIEIGGHINKPNEDRVHPNSPSFKLSEARARAVYNYLIDHGIQAERLRYQGYGNWEMINPNANTEIQMQLNRRVELKIIE